MHIYSTLLYLSIYLSVLSCVHLYIHIYLYLLGIAVMLRRPFARRVYLSLSRFNTQKSYPYTTSSALYNATDKPTLAEKEEEYKASMALIKKTQYKSKSVLDSPIVSDVPDVWTSKALTEDNSAAACLALQPIEEKHRLVKIEQKPKNAMQSATYTSNPWYIKWKDGARWTNPLMGYTSIGDTRSNSYMMFDTLESAIQFAETQGWKYEVSETPEKVYKNGTKKYAFNFLPEAVEKDLSRNGKDCIQFDQPGFGNSNWFMPLTFHGDKEVDQHGDPQPKKK